MPNVEIHRQADETLRRAVADLAAASERVDGFRFLSDHLWLDLHDASGVVLAAVIAGESGIVAYAQASPANRGVIVESTVDPDHRHDAGLEPAVLEALFTELSRATPDPASALASVPADDGIAVTWWTHHVGPHHDAIANTLGLTPVRDLLQMQRPLPTEMAVTVETRSFEVGRDEEAWLAVNNRAFAAHGEQGGWDLATLHQREAESWFDPSGFRLHERDGRLAAFCWTKLHHAPQTDADANSDAGGDTGISVGEIYVIGVDPDFQGLGLGRQLTLAGLESIFQRGMPTGMLYVDGDNTPAVGLYDALGFSVVRTDRAYTTTLQRTTTA